MTPRDRDNDVIRAALGELRAADEREAPSFDRVVARRSRRILSLHPVLRSVAIAAAVVLVAGISYRAFSTRAERFTVPNEVVALSTWRAASDVLLETPISNLLRDTPRLGASLITTTNPGDTP